MKRCLIIDDDESFRQLITRHINGILPDAIVEEYDPALSGPPPTDFDWTGCDLVILDYFLNSSLTGLDLLNEWKKQEHFPPVIMMTAAGSEDIAVRAMKYGVQDYLRKQNITREKLKQAIEDAIQIRNAEREQEAANTQNSQSFNKALFYKKLEQAATDSESGQVFVLIDLDQYTELGEAHGVILQDSVIKHIARVTYKVFSDTDHLVSMTRMSDASIGLLCTLPTGTSLQQTVTDLGRHLHEHPYDNDGSSIVFTVSIAGVGLSEADKSANDIMRIARRLCRHIQDNGGNDCALHMPGGTYSDVPATQTDTRAVPAVSEPETISPTTTTANPAAGTPTAATTRSTATAAASAPPSEADFLEMTLEMPAEKLHGQSDPADSDADTGFDILQALNDNRLLQYYQPIMPLSEKATQIDREYYSIRIRMVDTDGVIIEADKIMPELRNKRNQKLLDRWLLRQAVGRIVSYRNNKQQSPVFLIKISEESFADSSLFNWLQSKLMKSIAGLDVGKSLCIEVAADTYLTHRRQVEALFKFMRQSYGFRFALSSFSSVEQLNSCLEKSHFDIVKISQKLLDELQSQQSDPASMPASISQLKEHGSLLVATFIEDAAMLTQAINGGADFAMGYFIGEPIDNINNDQQIESFELT
ncbi:EAL domain-containing protein (putative c-di-GMP-specific phosphodiesterase class I)/FixJ family two-component response regulator [Methylohalomonas lacus]|uniref:EAL domain-containing protein (Putative c-di-GMP-specific phosphodiesterase class I)/FixJ family two-component response regulator n=1 Tax=Methylohalomonas lacus TaxID=398773 RepID=A0AAE3HHN9_9GAMM|nr:EAL domain-containing protein (putative c-di-GMP-specific phosphodiesterase class I)/FixJ family two-component response regulator [Methylohalomonas lacus]